jgi:hypothetical protein
VSNFIRHARSVTHRASQRDAHCGSVPCAHGRADILTFLKALVRANAGAWSHSKVDTETVRAGSL